MEYPAKRRRIDPSYTRPIEEPGIQIGRFRSKSLSEKRERDGFTIPKLALPSLKDQAYDTLLKLPQQKLQDIFAPQNSLGDEDRKLRVRELGRRQPSVNLQVNNNIPAVAHNAVNPVAQPVKTVVADTLNNGHQILSDFIRPSPIALPNIGKSNMNPGAAPVVNTNPIVPNPVQPSPGEVYPAPGQVFPAPAAAASAARAMALATQEAIAHQYNAVPGPPDNSKNAATVNAPAQNNPVPSQETLAVSGPGFSAQQVLSTPPTPLPATPQTPTSPTGSYFLSSSPSDTASPSLSPQASKSPLPFSSSNKNSTTFTASTLGTATSVSLSTSNFNSATISKVITQTSTSETSVSSAVFLNSLSSGFATRARSSESSSLSSASVSSSMQFASSVSASATPSIIVGGGGPTPSMPVPFPSPPVTSSSGSGGGGISPTTQKLVGGIVGGCAGLALLLFALLFFLRYRRNKMGTRREISPPMPQTSGSGGTGTMTQRSSTAPIATAGFLGRLRPASSQTAGTLTSSSTGPSERGFQKISGRKLPSVLASGGDGYGDSSSSAGPSKPPGAGARGLTPGQGPYAGLAPALQPSSSRSLSGSSFYRDSQGFYGGGGSDPTQEQADTTETSSSVSPQYPTPLAAAGRGAPGELPNIRPGPARTPVIHQPAEAPIRTQSRPSPPTRPARDNAPPAISDFPRPPTDGLGRSHPSQDGSRGSRFREDTTPP